MKAVVHESPGRGRGVFAAERIEPGDVICSDPIVEIPRTDLVLLTRTPMARYWWAWGDEAAVVMGAGSMLNHAYPPEANAANRCLKDARRMQFYATRTIMPGDEILIDYTLLES